MSESGYPGFKDLQDNLYFVYLVYLVTSFPVSDWECYQRGSASCTIQSIKAEPLKFVPIQSMGTRNEKMRNEKREQ
jgi:hypothetical protein